MPTENRSSNTEMVSVPRQLTREMLNGVCMHPDLARSLWSALLKNAPQAAEQHQREPVAIVTKGANDKAVIEFLSHDLQVGTELYTHADPGELDRLQTSLSAVKFNLNKTDKGLLAADAEVRRLRAQLAERDALLAKMKALFRVDDPFDLYDAVCTALSTSAVPQVKS